MFTRRDPGSVQASVPVVSLQEVESYTDKVDVMILCGGSATDLPEQGPELSRLFHTVDSFDTHARIPEYFEAVNGVAQASGHVSVISTGWDPGLFSLNRLLFEAALPQGAYNLLGTRRQPRTLGCDSPRGRRQKRRAVHHSFRGSSSCCPQRGTAAVVDAR